MKPRPPAPPATALWLLSMLLPREMREPFIGDLEETFYREVFPQRGLHAARRWFWGETLRAPLFLKQTRKNLIAHRQTGESWMSHTLADLSYALRLMLRRPGYSSLVILVFALGIGAATAIFSVVHPILLASLPYPHPERIVLIWERGMDGGQSNVGFATYTDIKQSTHTMEAVAAVGGWAPTFTGRAEPEVLIGQRVSSEYLRVLGVPPALGRDFAPEETASGAPQVVILGHALWRSRFGEDSTLVGRPITLNGNPYTVIGVMPRGFENMLNPAVQIWTPLRYSGSQPPACRSCRHLRVVARLRPDVARSDAEREMNALSQNLVRDYPKDYGRPGMLMPSLQDDLTAGVRPALVALLGAVLFVLAIACANVANLQVGRGVQRQGEFSVRLALGAGRGTLVRQMVTENLALSLAGGLLGILVAHVGVRLLVSLGPSSLPRLTAVHVSGPVLAFTLGITLVCGLIVGLIPALHFTDLNLHGAIKSYGRIAGGARRTRAALVVSEVALALVLLVGSGLMLRSLSKLFAVSPGFSEAGLLTMQVKTGGNRYESDTATWRFFDQALEAVRAQPGIRSAAFSSQLPLSNDFDAWGIHLEARPSANPMEDPSAFRYSVSAGYLETMGIPVIRGRRILPTDRAGQPPVALVSASLAQRLWPGGDPLGERIRVGDPSSGAWRTVVGIVGDVRHVSLSAEQPNAVYVPEVQWFFADNIMTLVVRASEGTDPSSLISRLRQTIWSVDKDQPIMRAETMAALVSQTAAQRRFALVLFEVFAVVALVLAAAGIYGVLAGSVVERLRELGVRTALGASRGDIISLVIRQGLAPVGTGAVLGIVIAVGVTRAVSGLLFGVSTLDPTTYASVTLLLATVAVGACWIPAWRAARVDPMVTLRSE